MNEVIGTLVIGYVGILALIVILNSRGVDE